MLADARIQQDDKGRLFVGRGAGVPLTNSEQTKLTLAEVPCSYVQHGVSDAAPNNALLPHLVQQMQPDTIFSGKEAPFKLQLTQISDGCVLGVSVSHILADAEALGRLLSDLATLYRGQTLTPRQQTRLGMQQIIAQAAGLLPSTSSIADEDIVATLPSLEQAPASFEAVVELGPYIFRGLTAEERKAGTVRSAQLLHVPGECLKRLRQHILHSKAAKQAGVDYISQTDVACALLWLIKEAAGDNDLKGSLHQPISNIMGLRANGYNGLEPIPYFGNAVSLVVIQPPTVTSEGQNGSSDLGELLAAAACAVRLTTQMFRADVAGSAKQLMAALPALVQAECLRNADMNPFKGCCVDVVSWRNMYNDVDFGQGRPVLTLGAAMPSLTNISWIIEALDGDGVYCTIWLLQQQLDRLQKEQLLQHLVPDASFIQASSK